MSGLTSTPPPIFLEAPPFLTPPPLLKELFCRHRFDFFPLFPRLTKIQRGQVWIQSYTFYLQISIDQSQTKEGSLLFARKCLSQVCRYSFIKL